MTVPWQDNITPEIWDTNIADHDARERAFGLVNGRRATAHVVTTHADRYGRDGDNTVDMGTGNEAPGTRILIHPDGEGAARALKRALSDDIPGPAYSGGDLTNGAPGYDMCCVPVIVGVADGGEDWRPRMVSTFGGNSTVAAAINQPMATFSCGPRTCACDGYDPSMDWLVPAFFDTSNLLMHSTTGAYTDWPGGIMFCDGPMIDIDGRHAYDPSTGRIRQDNPSNIRDNDHITDRLGFPAGSLGGTYRTAGADPDRERGRRLNEHLGGTASTGGCGRSANPNAGNRVLELHLWITLDVVGIAAGIAMMGAPTGFTQILGAMMFVGAVAQLVAHVDEFYSLVSGNPGLMSQEIRDNLATIGAILEIGAGVLQLVGRLAPKALELLKGIKRKIDDLLNAAKSAPADDLAKTGKSPPSVTAKTAPTPANDLAAHEAAGGHAIARHVGKTEAELSARLADEKKLTAASSFDDLCTADRVVERSLATHQKEIREWLGGLDKRLVLRGIDVGEEVGSVLHRGADSATRSSRIRIVLDQDPSMPGGYRITTAFPE